MIYVALLRGINVGGKAKVDMKHLKTLFEQLGFDRVKTYINSGNVIFASSIIDPSEIHQLIEAGIIKQFGLSVPVVIRDLPSMEQITQALPDSWTNDQTMKCDVMFLWPAIDSPDILKQMPHKPDIEDVLYVPGALFWRIDRDKVNKGQMLKIIGTDIYKQMTIRNCNTVRKLMDLMHQAVP
jgi:uncharacterized protein (DUF1697 family)